MKIDFRRENVFFTKEVLSSACLIYNSNINITIPRSPNIVNLFEHTGRSRGKCKINVRIGSSVIHTLVDTGAAVSVTNTKTHKTLKLVDKLYHVYKSDLLGVRGVNNDFIRVLGKVTLPAEIGSHY